MRVKLSLVTLTDVNEFVNKVSTCTEQVMLTDKDRNFIVNGKSIFGAIYTMEWDEVWCECEKDIYSHISKFVSAE